MVECQLPPAARAAAARATAKNLRQWLLMVLSAVLPAVRVASARAAAGARAPGAAARAAVANGHRVQGNQSPTKQPSLQIVIVAAKG